MQPPSAIDPMRVYRDKPSARDREGLRHWFPEISATGGSRLHLSPTWPILQVTRTILRGDSLTDLQKDQSHPTLTGDAAKRLISEDEFGLGEIVQSITKVVRSRVSANGYAIGIEGKWGSGKTTLLNFVEEALTTNADAYQKVIRFDPWLIGDKQSLLRAFFAELSGKIEEFRRDARVRKKVGAGGQSALKRLSEQIPRYAKYIDLGGKAASSAATLDPSLYTGVAACVLSGVSAIAKAIRKPPPTLEALKETIVGDLQVLSSLLPGASITVLMDDTDRLEPKESVEVLRLIKAVANFPLVVYLVCFDMAILSSQVQRVIKVGTGGDYLEKIFQQIVPLPPQEPFALRRLVRLRLAEVFPAEASSPDPTDLESAERQDVVFEKWAGKMIQTPRDAIRLCESVKFGWPYLRGKVDFLDYVWLQLIKLRCRPLYDWTENYVTNLGAYRDGGRPGDDEPASEAAKLRVILEGYGWGHAPDRSGITSMLPGLKSFLSNGTKSTVFQFDPPTEMASYEEHKRLGSPSHWRFYFAFDKPSYALSDAEVAAFLRSAAQDYMPAAQILRDLTSRSHRVQGFYLNVLLERLRDRPKPFTAGEQIGMARAFAEMMDEVPRGSMNQFGDSDAWRRAVVLLGSSVAPEFADIVRVGRSINWLAIVMRDQGFALGVTDKTRVAPERQWLTRSNFDEALKIIIERFRKLGLSSIFGLPEPGQVLFCWQQLGDSTELRNLIAAETRDDVMFIRTLQAMRNWVNSSSQGLYQALHADVVNLFMDSGAAKDRLRHIANEGSHTDEVRRSASELLATWDDSMQSS